MADLNLKRFKEKVEQYYSSVSPDGKRRATQKQLAEAIHIDTYELNRRLNGTDEARLTLNDIQLIVKTLAEWRANITQKTYIAYRLRPCLVVSDEGDSLLM